MAKEEVQKSAPTQRSLEVLIDHFYGASHEYTIATLPREVPHPASPATQKRKLTQWISARNALAAAMLRGIR